MNLRYEDLISYAVSAREKEEDGEFANAICFEAQIYTLPKSEFPAPTSEDWDNYAEPTGEWWEVEFKISSTPTLLAQYLQGKGKSEGWMRDILIHKLRPKAFKRPVWIDEFMTEHGVDESTAIGWARETIAQLELLPNPEERTDIVNLSSLSLLEKQGFEGPDCLEESLREYGIAWLDLGEEILFIYRLPTASSRLRFDRATVSNLTDIQDEYSFVDFDELIETCGMSREEWFKLSRPLQVSDILSYHGCLNTFGESHWEGFQIDFNV